NFLFQNFILSDAYRIETHLLYYRVFRDLVELLRSLCLMNMVRMPYAQG
ncbi:unnamed protein product, partial [Staurois parvus]